MVRQILVPRPGIEPMPYALKAQSLNHWTAREFPEYELQNLPVGNFSWDCVSISLTWEELLSL